MFSTFSTPLPPLALVATLVFLSAGCGSQPGAVKPPSFDPGKMASAAIAQLDQNGNGQLEQPEWQASPAIAGSIEVYDTSGDKVLSQEEIAAGLARWQTGDMGARPLPFQVTLGGKPLEGAEVKLIPEAFFGGAIKPASGTAGPGGPRVFGSRRGRSPQKLPKTPPHPAGTLSRRNHPPPGEGTSKIQHRDDPRNRSGG
jgi:hypothetical protein